MNNPLVSVIIPFHNNENTISRAIDSVLKQTYKNIEIILIDDFSSDNGVAVVKSYSDPRIRLFQNKENLKAGLTRNVGLDNAKGEYIAFLDADDAYAPGKIELDVEFLEQHKEFDFVCSELYPMGNVNAEDNNVPFEFNELTLKGILTRSAIFTSTVVMRSSIKERFPENFFISEDLYYWCLILIAGHRIAHTNRKMSFYNNGLENRLSLNFRKQYINEKKVVDFAYSKNAISKFDRFKLKFLYFLKYLRRPIKFKILAHKQKKLNKKEGK